MPNHKVNLLGKTFGNWTVIAEAPTKKTSYNRSLAMWTCQCKCGVIKEIAANDLRDGKTKSCMSCAAKDRAIARGLNTSSSSSLLKENKIGYLKEHPRIKDLSGLQKEHYKVICYNSSDKRGQSLWKCKCECGNEFIARQSDIVSNKRINCGCSTKSNGEIKIEDILKINNINYRTEYSFSDLKDINLLRFDFAILDENNNLIKLIEYQGEQHYYNISYFKTDPKQHDELKRNYCKIHNIKLLEIPYWDFNKINIDYLLKE